MSMELHYKKFLGALTDAEAEMLFVLAESAPLKRIIEIGTFVGKSASVLAQACDTLVCVDTFPKDMKYCGSDIVVTDTLKTFLANMESIGLMHKIISFKGHTSNVLPNLNGKFGMIYIDGGHTISDVLPNSLWAWEHLPSGGVLAWHDYDTSWQDIKIVVDTLCTKWGKELRQAGSLVSITK